MATNLGKTNQEFATRTLALHPSRRPLVFPLVCNRALLSTGNKFENDLLASVYTSLPVILGRRQDQPVAGQNFIGPALGQDLVAAV